MGHGDCSLSSAVQLELGPGINLHEGKGVTLPVRAFSNGLERYDVAAVAAVPVPVPVQ